MKFAFTLTGLSPLLFHADDVEKADALGEWRKDSHNKDVSKPGDDRSPPWTWQTYLYSDGDNLVLPQDNLSAALLSAGAGMILKGRKSMKEASQTAVLLHEDFFTLLVNGKSIAISEIDKLSKMTFQEQSEAVKELGFSLFVKRATVGSSKHVRVRPRFDNWSFKGTAEIVSQEMTEDSLRRMFDDAGFYKGLCDWRPGSPKKPGRFGRFKAELKKAA